MICQETNVTGSDFFTLGTKAFSIKYNTDTNTWEGDTSTAHDGITKMYGAFEKAGQYYAYIEANDLANANKVLEDNAELLKPYRLDMNGINKIEKAISDLADIAFSTQQIIISATEPTGSNLGVGTEWYQPY